MVIAENLSEIPIEFSGVVGSFLVKIFDINVGSVGISERSADDSKIDQLSVWGTFPDKPDYYPESKTFVAKLVLEKSTERVLGLQAVGEGDICRRIDVISSLLQNKSTLDDILNFEHGYAPPYSEAIDPLHHLARIAKSVKRGYEFIKPDLKNISKLNNAILIDVREAEEFENEPVNLKNILNIPLNDLKERLNELDKSRPIYIICKRGPRSYQAAVILKYAGFGDVKILAGGKTAINV
jgi:rhodanese-related sulfurtransferase